MKYMAKKKVKELSAKETEAFITLLKSRFEKNKNRHQGVDWSAVEKKLAQQPEKLVALYEMEQTGGEPDLVLISDKKNEWTFVDCAAESPKERRSVCYDPQALASRKENKPKHSAIGMAEEMGVKILNEEEYRKLQTFGVFDQKTSSWIETTASVRKLGGALFCDYRYGQVFTYHNGAESYYAARGFRAKLVL